MTEVLDTRPLTLLKLCYKWGIIYFFFFFKCIKFIWQPQFIIRLPCKKKK